MPSENIKKFRSMVGRYLAGKASEGESDMIEKYYELFAEKPDQLPTLSPGQRDGIKRRMRDNITRQITPTRFSFLPKAVLWRAAAALIILIGAAWLFVFLKEQAPAVTHYATKVTHESATGQTRFLALPDGSRVILHGDARIAYDQNFNKKNREVTLTGEAYFDVVHLNQGGRKPVSFVIKTGNISTTVLGTAFSIKSVPNNNQVVVTVTRGKVRVDDGDRKTVLLTANQQITYNTRTAVAEEKIVKSQELTAWVQADMIFQDLPFATLAGMLEKRYGVKISFQNPDLKKCLINGRFSGTETLEEVFRVLTMTSNTSYVVAGSELLVSGEGCY